METTIETMEGNIANLVHDIELVEIVEGHINTRWPLISQPDPEMQELVRQRRHSLIKIYENLFHIDVHSSLFKEVVDRMVAKDIQRPFLKLVEKYLRNIDKLFDYSTAPSEFH